MYVGESAGSCFVTGCMTELNVRIVSSNFNNIVFETKTGSEDDLATFFCKLAQSGLAFCRFGSVVLVDDLIRRQAKALSHIVGTTIMVIGVTHIAGVGNVYETNLQILFRNAIAGRFRSGSSCVCVRSRGSIRGGSSGSLTCNSSFSSSSSVLRASAATGSKAECHCTAKKKGCNFFHFFSSF